jgi:hypothetical protein
MKFILVFDIKKSCHHCLSLLDIFWAYFPSNWLFIFRCSSSSRLVLLMWRLTLSIRFLKRPQCSQLDLNMDFEMARS